MRWFLVWMVVLIALAGCGERGLDLPTEPSESVERTEHQPVEGGMAKLVLMIPQDIQPPVRSAEYEITGLGISDPIKGTMSILNDEAHASVTNIPAGRNRKFTINVFGDKSIVTFSGSSEVDVISRETVQVVIDLARLNGVISVRGYPSSNATHVEITVSAPDIPEPIVQVFRYSSGTFKDNVTEIPTGADRIVTLKAYDTSPDKITDMGTATVDVYPSKSDWITIDLSFTGGSAEIVGRFPG